MKKASWNYRREVYALKCDIRQFFDGKGLPLGNVTSQLFANIYLNELDQYAKHVLKQRYYLRYCDDFIIVDVNEKHLSDLVPRLDYFLQSRLGLALHPKKIYIRKLSHGIDFLGYVSLPHHRVLRTKTKRRMFKKMRRQVQMVNEGLVDEYSFKQSLESYAGMLKHCHGYRMEERLRNDVRLLTL